MLLSLGVSYTNELDQRRALSYLHTWLANHAKHGPKIANMQHPEDTSQKLSWVISLFETAAASAPADADVQVRVIPPPPLPSAFLGGQPVHRTAAPALQTLMYRCVCAPPTLLGQACMPLCRHF